MTKPTIRNLRASTSPEAFRRDFGIRLRSRDWHEVLAEAEDWSEFVEWCRYAAFLNPGDLSGDVTIYRGGAGSVEIGASRPFWTLDPDVACFFAQFWSSDAEAPFVLRATVPASELIYYSNNRTEQEVIPARLPVSSYDVSYDRAAILEGSQIRMRQIERNKALRLRAERISSISMEERHVRP